MDTSTSASLLGIPVLVVQCPEEPEVISVLAGTPMQPSKTAQARLQTIHTSHAATTIDKKAKDPCDHGSILHMVGTGAETTVNGSARGVCQQLLCCSKVNILTRLSHLPEADKAKSCFNSRWSSAVVRE